MFFTAHQKELIKRGKRKTKPAEKRRIRERLKKKYGIKRLRRRKRASSLFW